MAPSSFFLMKKFIKVSILIASGLIAATLIIAGCSSSNKDDLKPETSESEIIEPKALKEVKTIFLPIGGFTSGFIYCGFDGDKSILDQMISEGWQVKNITPQSFQTSKRNGDIVLCNGSSYLLER